MVGPVTQISPMSLLLFSMSLFGSMAFTRMSGLGTPRVPFWTYFSSIGAVEQQNPDASDRP